MTWYRQYRPQRVADLQLSNIRHYLSKILETGQYAQAYLFAGPRGTGKTSSARIIAKLLNDPANTENVLKRVGPLSEPNENDPILVKIAKGTSSVVIEQDAASHRGIDDVRQLQESISVSPSEGVIRVVILDEVHMLTNEAFNALLKMLEEPPERVVFVLATTELDKVPLTVQSRCEVIRFRPANTEEIESVLHGVAAGEGINLSAEHSQQLAKLANGSFRDAIKFFEQVSNGKSIDETILLSLTGSSVSLDALMLALAQKNPQGVQQFFAKARGNGISWTVLETLLFTSLQQRLHRGIERKEADGTLANIVALLDHLSSKVGGPEPLPGLRLELACLSWCFSGVKPTVSAALPVAPKKPTEKLIAEKKDEEVIEVVISAPEEIILSSPEASISENIPLEGNSVPSAITKDDVETRWKEFLLTVRTKSSALEALLRNSTLGQVENGCVEFVFSLDFHREKLTSARYQQLCTQALQEFFDPGVRFAARYVPPAPIVKATPSGMNEEDQLLRAVEDAVLSLG